MEHPEVTITPPEGGFTGNVSLSRGELVEPLHPKAEPINLERVKRLTKLMV